MKNSFTLSDTNYREQMDTLVTPFLKKRMEEIYAERKPGKKIYCIRYKADFPRGIILISHGFTESAEKYREMAYYFVRTGYHTYIPEHCGHGRSYRLTDDLSLVHIDRYERYVKDLLFVARMAQKKHPGLPVYLFGHSMGGGIAAATAGIAPRQFQRIVLSSPMVRPATGNVPWQAAQLIAAFFCKIGKDSEYVIGHHPYEPLERFEDSAATSRSRFSYYQEMRQQEPLFQMNAASYGWLREAGRLNHFLMNCAWRRIQSPILLFQAEQDDFVCNREQELFVQKLNHTKAPVSVGGKTVPFARIISVPGTKHEIFNSDSEIVDRYCKIIFDFFKV